MGTYTNGVYVPALGEVGWGDEVNDFLTRSGEEYVNVKAAPYSATGDGATDDSAAFVAAETAAGVGGKMYVPPGTYRLDNWTPTKTRLTVEGAGVSSVLKAKAAATYAVSITSLYNTSWKNLCIDGNSLASGGLRLTTNGAASSQGQTFDRVRFQNCLVGMKIEDGGAVDQTDKNLYLNCVWADNTTGLWLQAQNCQEQLLLGGSFDSHTTAVRITHGSFTWIGGQVQTATTSFLLDGSDIQWLNLRDVITEATTTDINGVAAWPVMGVVAESCVFQAFTYNARVGLAGSILMTKGCKFYNGAIDFGASDMMWDSKFDTVTLGASWVLSAGTNQRRILTDINGVHTYFNSAATPVSHVYTPGGEIQGKLATNQKAGIPADGDFFFPVNGQMVVDSTNSRLYCRVGGVWKYTALT